MENNKDNLKDMLMKELEEIKKNCIDENLKKEMEKSIKDLNEIYEK